MLISERSWPGGNSAVQKNKPTLNHIAAMSPPTGVETLGGLIAATLGRIPEVGEQIGIGGRELRVEARDGRRIATVRLLPLATRTEQRKATSDGPRSS
jgi:Mg2+/Co2+ transporter CorC